LPSVSRPRRSRPRRAPRDNQQGLPRLSQRLTAAQQAELRKMFVLLYASIGRLQSLRRLLGHKVGLDTSEFSVIMALNSLQSRPDIRIRDIADQMYAAPANVTATLGKLQRKGWVLKTASNKDSRAVSVRLTERARARLERLRTDLLAVNDAWFENVEIEDIQTVSEVFDNLIRLYPRARLLSEEIKPID